MLFDKRRLLSAYPLKESFFWRSFWFLCRSRQMKCVEHSFIHCRDGSLPQLNKEAATEDMKRVHFSLSSMGSKLWISNLQKPLKVFIILKHSAPGHFNSSKVSKVYWLVADLISNLSIDFEHCRYWLELELLKCHLPNVADSVTFRSLSRLLAACQTSPNKRIPLISNWI